MKFRQLFAIGLVAGAFSGLPRPPEPFTLLWVVWIVVTLIYLLLVTAGAAYLSSPDRPQTDAATETERAATVLYLRIMAALARAHAGRTESVDQVLDRLAQSIRRGDHIVEEHA